VIVPALSPLQFRPGLATGPPNSSSRWSQRQSYILPGSDVIEIKVFSERNLIHTQSCIPARRKVLPLRIALAVAGSDFRVE
jgi:hypothetical protein